MAKILVVQKDWGSQGILSYQIDLFKHLTKMHECFIITREDKTTVAGFKTLQIHSVLEVLKCIVKVKPDILLILHYFGSPLALLLIIVSKLLRIKSVIVTDFTEAGLPRIHRSPLKTIKDVLRYILFLSQLILVDAPVCFTEYEVDILSKIYPLIRRKCKIIPIGNNFDIRTSKKENYILTVSRWWSDRKNLHTILKVFSEVVKEKECKLVVVGKFIEGKYHIPDENRWETGEEYRQKIMKLIDELNLKNYVEFVGVKMGKELQELFRKARIFYLPSKNETFGMVFVEAMASGTPIVAMKNSAVQYVVKDGVTGFLRNDEEGQKEAILKLLTDERLYKEVQKNCLKEAEKYKWKSVIKKWERLIEELVEGKYERRRG